MTIDQPAADAVANGTRRAVGGAFMSTAIAPAVSGSTTSASDQAIALTAVDSLDLNSSGIGMYPLSQAALTGADGALQERLHEPCQPASQDTSEQTISYVANTIG